MQTTHIKKTERGIVLLEAIVAIGVLATIFTATMSLFVTSVGGIRIVNDQLVATFLAQDAMEHVIAKRQYNSENSLAWLDGMSNCISTDPCLVDFYEPLANTFTNCGVNCPLYMDGSVYTSSNASGVMSYFSRSVEIEILNASGDDYEARVTIRVSWKDGSTVNQFPLIFNLYDDPI